MAKADIDFEKELWDAANELPTSSYIVKNVTGDNIFAAGFPYRRAKGINRYFNADRPAREKYSRNRLFHTFAVEDNMEKQNLIKRT